MSVPNVEPTKVYAEAMLRAWRVTKDFLRDRLLTSGRSDVNINAVLRVMNEALNDPATTEPQPPIDVERLARALVGRMFDYNGEVVYVALWQPSIGLDAIVSAEMGYWLRAANAIAAEYDRLGQP